MIRPDGNGRIEIRNGVDTDHDGHPDTMVLPVRDELALVVDLDRDNLADLLVRIGADGSDTTIDLHDDPNGWLATDPDADACYEDWL
ncbi:hypothetical protein [Pseudonocardia acaciae]|uniref:hypothetical protein n=1 Tax=Pseudonocardia acaciae TaxID=551276 RepID=UPI00055D153B|nr:hypothetical protein [Pseudonocardia acaciae]